MGSSSIPRSIPVQIPREVRVGDPIRADTFNALIRAVRQLEARGRSAPGGFTPSLLGGSHPFKVSRNGDATLDVAGGYVRHTTGAGATLVTVETAVSGATVTVTGTGSIWLSISLTSYQLNRYHSLEIDTGLKQTTSTPSISFLATASAPSPSSFSEGSSEIEDATTLYVRIADVSLNGGVAQIDAVYLRDHYQLPYISYGIDS